MASPAMATELQPPAWAPYSQRSLCEDFDSEWRTRKISIMGVVRSFVTQLKPGQDLTRVSIPVALLFPFSMLEVAAMRECGYFNESFGVNSTGDPRERMLAVCRWYLTTVQNENFHKKPYNPILGEMHHAWTSTPEHKKTYFLAEQVSHHPPVSAFVLHNPQEDVTIYSTASFSVKLQTNNAIASVEGSAEMTFGKLSEKYLLSRRLPDTKITNVIIGTRRMFWQGELTISCAKTGLSAAFSFKEKGGENYVRVSVFADADASDELYIIEGRLGGVMHITPKNGEKRQFADLGAVRLNKLHYPDVKQLEVWSSQVVWAEANKYIVLDDIEKAEEAKKHVEQQQRLRAEARKQLGTEWTPRFFTKQDGIWVLNEAGWKKLFDTQDRAAEEEDFGFDPLLPLTAQSKKKPPSPALPAHITADLQRRPSNVELQTVVPTPSHPSPAVSLLPSTNTPPPSAVPKGLQFTGPAAVVPAAAPSSSLASSQQNAAELLANEKSKLPRNSMRITSNVSGGGGGGGGGIGGIGGIGIGGGVAVQLPASSSSSGSSPSVEKLSPELDEKGNILTGWMKLRNAMKVWKSRWFVLRPGRLLYFKEEKHEAKKLCVGILELADCRAYARPTVKEGFAFKIDNVLSNPIYAKIGLKGEGIPYARMPVGSLTSAILLVGSEQERKSWMSAIQEQISFATAQRTGGQLPSHVHPTASAVATSASANVDVSDEDEVEESLDGPGISVVLQRYDESQRQLFSGLAAQQVKIQRSLAKSITELDDRLQTIEKRLSSVSAAVNKSSEASSTSVIGLLMYVVLATALAMLVVRFLGRYLL